MAGRSLILIRHAQSMNNCIQLQVKFADCHVLVELSQIRREGGRRRRRRKLREEEIKK